MLDSTQREREERDDENGEDLAVVVAEAPAKREKTLTGRREPAPRCKIAGEVPLRR